MRSWVFFDTERSYVFPVDTLRKTQHFNYIYYKGYPREQVKIHKHSLADYRPGVNWVFKNLPPPHTHIHARPTVVPVGLKKNKIIRY